MPFGFDARLQFLHEDDAIAALVRGVTGTATGVVNVAGDGVLTALQAAAIVRRPVVMVPMAAAGPLGGLGKRLGLVDFSPDQMSFLAYGRGMDTTLMRESFGFTPTFTTRAAFEDFARTVSPIYPSLDTVGDAVSGIVGAAHQVLTRPARGAH